MSKLSYEELQRRYRNLYKKYRYWRHRQRELERIRRYRIRTSVSAEAGVEADVPEDVRVACSELDKIFDEE